MLREVDNFFLRKEEPVKGCLLALRDIILRQDPEIEVTWKYGMPVFCYKRKMFCYLWVHKELMKPYLGIVEGKHIIHPKLLTEKRSRMKIMLFDSNKNLPVKTIESILQQALALYKNGTIPI